VLTYLTPAARKVVIRGFRESIPGGGFLVLGNSESLPRRCGFTTVSTPWARVYRRSCPTPE
jgi:chemotaxis methyl-accepting protein methylase